MTTFFTQEAVEANPTAYSFNMTSGFKFIGSPKIPSPPRGPASACEPVGVAEEGSWHRIYPPHQLSGTYVRMRWMPGKKCWIPPLESAGRRVAFSSQYLAAAGWTYGEAE